MQNPKSPEIFVSYASQDKEKVLNIVNLLEKNGLRVWRDETNIPGGKNYGPEIVRAIRSAKILLLMCSNASMRSKNVKQEIQLAWKYDVPYLSVLLEPVQYPEQIEYWLEGWQWIEIQDSSSTQWLSRLLEAMQFYLGSTGENFMETPSALHSTEIKIDNGITTLRKLASFTDQIWPIPANTAHRGPAGSTLRDLGAPQDNVRHDFRLGDRVRLAIETEHDSHLLLLNEGTSGAIYCLCPSLFAPETFLARGKHILPQPNSPYDSFVVSGSTGQEHLLAILTDDPLDLDWLPQEDETTARVLSREDISNLLQRLDGLEANQWSVLSTWFQIN